ncbi:MAG: hypothetical protein ACRDJW_24455, partial [Thermomicrobiales bacterium]
LSGTSGEGAGLGSASPRPGRYPVIPIPAGTTGHTDGFRQKCPARPLIPVGRVTRPDQPHRQFLISLGPDDLRS